MGPSIPHRFEMFHVSLILFLASLAWLTCFTFQQAPPALLNAGFVIASTLLLHGFLLHLHWAFIVNPEPTFGKLAIVLKVVGSLLFFLRPLTLLANGNPWTWSDLAGISCLHVG